MELARGIEPPTVAESALKLALSAPARGPAPSHAPHEGDTSPSKPLGWRFNVMWSWREELNPQPAVYKLIQKHFLLLP